ncbi:sugar transferase [Modestobacter sp. KNN46-3]|jgi:lipopolysaccharide/colanic/teichoic acid biosynthesis glycosyltransferase|uniref:sugar transferase n=1 Tax=Modestobacter sp. KNN46-3 TaxID=2711218 RepID=UPI0013E01765|nr:sugar transferase [Modestobacter sp. KNN46-3]
MTRRPRTRYARYGKRAVDLVGSALMLTASAPLHAACAAAVRITSGRPVYFSQRRVGRDGVEFRVHKFRTMVTDAEVRSQGYPSADMVTGVGRVLRRWSLDELPQLWNITKGEMSFVGPRPTLPDQVARYTARQRGRLAVRPGLTGLAQVRHRNDAPWSTRIETDLEYAERISLRGDLAVLLATVPVALRGSGIHHGQTATEVDDLGPLPSTA